MTALAAAEIERVFREQYGRAVAVLVRVFGDIDAAEEAVQDAFTAALERWPASGLPPSPAGWIITTARNRAIDRFRREVRAAELLARAERDDAGTDGEVELEEGAVRDDRLRLIFTCCASGARHGGAGRAHAAAARRADHGRDRARVPGPRGHDGAAAGAREGEDPRRRDSVPGAGRGRPAGPTPFGVGRRVSDLQRGPRGAARGDLCARGDPARAAARGAHPGRAGGAGAAGAHAAGRVAARGADRRRTARSCCWPTRTARDGTRR